MCCCRYYLAQPNHVHEQYHVSLVEHALGKESARDPEGYLRRHSVQVSFMMGCTISAQEYGYEQGEWLCQIHGYEVSF